jgi:hypothetical protein
MHKRNNSVPDYIQLSEDGADEAIYRALSLFIGRGRKFSCEDIETGTEGRIKADTIQKWIAGDPVQRKRPSAAKVLLLQQFIGVELTNKLLAPIGQGGRSLNAEEGSPAVVLAHLTADVATIAGCGVAGAWNHTHNRDLERAADDAILILEPLSSRGAK